MPKTQQNKKDMNDKEFEALSAKINKIDKWLFALTFAAIFLSASLAIAAIYLIVLC